jgi:Tfp pilus assembly protein PilF
MKKIYFIILLVVLFNVSTHAQGAKAMIMNNYVNTCKANSFFAFNFLNTGIQMIETGQYKRAINKLSKAIKNDNAYCDAWYLAGMVYLHGTVDTLNAKKYLLKAQELGYPINSSLDNYIKR